jgi:hypothetical protein
VWREAVYTTVEAHFNVLLIWCVQVLKSDVAAATDLLGKIVTVRSPRLCTPTSFSWATNCRCGVAPTECPSSGIVV